MYKNVMVFATTSQLPDVALHLLSNRDLRWNLEKAALRFMFADHFSLIVPQFHRDNSIVWESGSAWRKSSLCLLADALQTTAGDNDNTYDESETSSSAC